MLKHSRVFVTGADGFIGSHLVEMLVGQGFHVKAMAQYNSFNSWGWLEDMACRDEVEIVSGDIRDPNFIRQAVQGMDIVFHLAALIAIPYSYSSPDSYVQTNITGTMNVLNAVKYSGACRLVHTSTSEVYGTARYVPIDESHPLQPQSPYSASKISADAMVESFYRTYNLPVITARPFNTYGPRQSARAVIPSIITQLLSGAQHLNLGDLRPTRDLNYVEDTCRGFIALATCDAAVGEVINIGSGKEISVGDLVRLLMELTGREAKIRCEEARLRPEKSEVFRLCCDNSKIEKLTDFSPAVSLKEGLSRTIEWFSNPDHLSRYKAGIYNV